MKFEYKAEELSASKYVSGKYCLKQVIESGSWAIFSSYIEDGVRVFYVIDDDWGQGNINDRMLFIDRVENAKEEARYLMASAGF